MGAQRHSGGTRHGFTRGDIEASIVLRAFDFGAVDETLGQRGAAVCAQAIYGEEPVVGCAHDRKLVLPHRDPDDILS